MATASLIIFALAVGYASIIGKSGPETLNIRSAPEQASIVIIDEGASKIFEGKTPTTVSLEKKKGYFRGKKYTVKISKPGYAEQTITVDTRLNGWYLGGNLIFGGLIGWLIVDPVTGAMWTLDTNELNVTLEASKQSKGTDSYQFGIVLLDDVPQSLRNKMVKVSQ
ncbi:MAG: hypothetical protein COY75_06945 [Nitrospirae bacterium CG_4_10_14_0_8_um_filter_41_23]|nr:PEGA domain-containing protein [Nitrospirota bacterium]PIQ94082.1 MAG: hypothetical protein COV68_06465 [Nitrospirae bacterium CG11_big_fil_rev_8_21_14_0_20_41_14]PIV43680.1 MAG: hypothetical protein COS27_04270 [Nitrospirae bacterium CG02_land_8_20_14_3_00_41_53]PIW86316.1 MAG: hypothetical protein COZ94_11150 [Nitrospirae bacterium CG_4_8_14_3_um_filter_41_47]PIY86645.1 MAG: hypothetical protein COY75_06945 [Nitrospirae bacterium CG_4_10_14_0_8_um_filter_41_23]PJA79108.1 MAG: hypothetical